ncbi:hypothetical protein Emed_006739 [Eimeria media]
MARLASWEVSFSSSAVLLPADDKAEPRLLLKAERQELRTTSLTAATRAFLVHVERKRKQDLPKRLDFRLLLLSQIVLAALVAIVFLVLRCADSLGWNRNGVFSLSRRLAVGGEHPCDSSSKSLQAEEQAVEQAVEQIESDDDLQLRVSHLLQQLSLSAPVAAALTEEELEEVKTAKVRLNDLHLMYSDHRDAMLISQKRIQKEERFLQVASSLSHLSSQYPDELNSRKEKQEGRRLHHRRRMPKYQKATAALTAVTGETKRQLVMVACIQANLHAANRELSSAATAALAAAALINDAGRSSSGASPLASLTGPAKAALPSVLRSLQQRSESLSRQLWLARFGEETGEDVLTLQQEARLFIEQAEELMREWEEVGLEPLPAAFVEALKRLGREEKRASVPLAAAQLREAQPAPENGSQTALAASSSPGLAASDDLEEQATHQLLLVAPSVSANLSEGEELKVEEAQQRLAVLLQAREQKRVHLTRISRALVRAAEYYSQSSLQTSEDRAPAAQAAQPSEEEDLAFYRLWREEIGLELQAAEERLRAAAFHPHQEAFALLKLVQRKLEGSEPIALEEARAVVAAEVVLQFLKPSVLPPPPTQAERKGILDVVSKKRKLLPSLIASKAEALATSAQVAAAERAVAEAETLAAAAQLLLRPQVAAVEDLEASCAALRRQLQEAREKLREKLDEEARRQPIEKWIKILTVKEDVPPEESATRSHWNSAAQLEALILERASVLKEAREFVKHASPSSEENEQLAEALRSTETHLQALVRRMGSSWRSRCEKVSRKLAEAIRRSKRPWSLLRPHSASEASSAEEPEPHGEQQQRQQRGGQGQDSQEREWVEFAAQKATIHLLGLQHAAEEELQIFQPVAEVQPLGGKVAAAVDRVKQLVEEAAKETAARIALLADPLESELTAKLDRLLQLDATVKHKVVGMHASDMLFDLGIDPELQYGASLPEKKSLKKEINALMRRAEALLMELSAAGAPPSSLRGLSRAVKRTQNYGFLPI